MPPANRLCALALLVLMPLASAVQAGELARIVAAADLRFAMDELLEQFRATYPERPVEVIYGSSGRFRAQIEHGAPFDLFFSADIAYPHALQASGLVHGEVVPYALGRLVLWSDREDASALSLGDLTDARFRRIAIANPRHAPYGARAQEALEASGLWDELEPRLVYGDNIMHALQLVQSGAAEIGIVALALAKSPVVVAQGDYYLIDDSLHQPLHQGFVLTRRAAGNTTAQAFVDFIGRPESREIMQRYGFVLPEEE
ncbi:MAG: molybdate ABC transporter substrate-binding protein [Pseudomonadaceae bacterium]|nr:MAG: molybdate ABC transporter substrate-binding protein [Pseudomonadaceae bacterium]